MDKAITMKLVWLLFTSLGVATCVTVLTFLLRQKEFLSVFDVIETIDGALGKYGIEVSYFSECKTLHTINIIQAIFMPMYDIIIESYRARTPTHHLSENILFGISLPIRIHVFVLMALVYRSLTTKMSNINQILVKMGCYDKMFDADNDNDYEGYDNERTYEILKDLTTLHGTICHAANRLHTVLQPFLLLHISVNMFIVVVEMVVFLTLDKRIKVYEYVMHFLLFSTELVYLLRHTKRLAREVSTYVHMHVKTSGKLMTISL